MNRSRLLAAVLCLGAASAAAEETPAPAESPQEQPPIAAPETASEPAAAPPPSAGAPAGAVLTFKGMELRISGVLFASWQYLIDTPAPSGTNSDNAFDMNRAYVNIEPHVSKHIWLRITPDLVRVRNDDGSLNGSLALRLKYAYAQFDEVLPGLSIKVGMQHTAYLDYEESIWRYRVLGPSGYETFTRMSSADIGLAVLGTIPGGLLAYQVVVSNGEGYQEPEAINDIHRGKYKDLGVRLTAVPFAGSTSALKGLKLTLFGQYGNTQDPVGPVGALARIRGLALLSFESSLGSAAVGGGPTRDDLEDGEIDRGVLLSAFAFVNLPLHLRVLGRFDRFDPDIHGSGSATPGLGTISRSIGGVAYLITPDVQVIANLQHLSFENETRVTNPLQGTSFFADLEAKY